MYTPRPTYDWVTDGVGYVAEFTVSEDRRRVLWRIASTCVEECEEVTIGPDETPAEILNVWAGREIVPPMAFVH